MKKLIKRTLAVALAVMMCVALLPMNVLAAGYNCNHTPSFTMGDSGEGWTKCAKCGQEFKCENHSDIYCQWHGGYNEIMHEGGDGSCDYCHAKVDNPHCPGQPTEPVACNHVGTTKTSQTVSEATCTRNKIVDKYCDKCGEKVAQNEEVPNTKLGHDAVTYTDDNPNVDVSTGTHSWTCTKCHGEEAGGTDSGNHTYQNDANKAWTLAADNQTESRTLKCDSCTHTYTETRNVGSKIVKAHYTFNGTVVKTEADLGTVYATGATTANVTANVPDGYLLADNESTSKTATYANPEVTFTLKRATANLTIKVVVDGVTEDEGTPTPTNIGTDIVVNPADREGYDVEVVGIPQDGKMPSSDLTVTIKYTCKHDSLTLVGSTANCIAGGIDAHYECDTCHKLFTDAQGQNATTSDALQVPALGHQFPQGWTDDKNGDTHSHLCTVCGNTLTGGKETEDHEFGSWSLVEGSFTAWVADENDPDHMYRTATVERICEDCQYKETDTVKFSDTDRKGLTDNDLRRDKDEKTFDVWYLVQNGGTSTPALGHETVSLKETDAAVDVEIKDFAGYKFATADRAHIAFEDAYSTPVHVYYARNIHTLTINYIDGQRNPVAAPHTEKVAYGLSSTSVTSPSVTGFHLVEPDKAAIVSVDAMPDGDVTIDVFYANNPTLVIRYVYDDGTTAAATYSSVMSEGESYSVASPSIEGYTPRPAVVSGTMSATDAAFTVTYTRNAPPPPPQEIITPEPEQEPEPEPEPPIVIEEPDVPLGEEPDIEIDEPNVPMAEEPEIEIDELDVPLADVPQTGDNSQVWTLSALVSGIGLAWLLLSSKKRKTEI